jgi:DedD protein
MDRSLKERLIGAAVLVALGVWLIPWVLDGTDSDEASTEDPIALQLPVPETGEPVRGEPIRRQTIELDIDRRAAPTEVETEGPQVGADASEPEPAPETPQPRTAAAPATSNAPAPAASPTRPAQNEPSASPPPATARPSVVTSAPASGWMVQLGSFGDSANAQRQADRVRTFGQDPRIYEFTASGRLMYRVRVGPMETRERAEATASSLSAHGFVAQVVAPE